MIAQSGNVTLVLFEGLGRRNRAVVPQNVLQTIDSFHPKTERHILQEPKQKLKNTEVLLSRSTFGTSGAFQIPHQFKL